MTQMIRPKTLALTLCTLTLAACGSLTHPPVSQTSSKPTRQAVSTSVTFNVNLDRRIKASQFTPGTDTVGVSGSFGTVALTDPDGDRIYSGSASSIQSAAQITYNYRLNRAGNSINETVPPRKYVVQDTASSNTLNNWFNDELPAYPYARFYASSSKAIPGEVVRYFDDSEGGAATSWSWSFPGASPGTSNQQNPTVTYGAPGTYTATLTVTNGSGSSTSKSMSITVANPESTLGWWNDAVFYQVYPRSYLDTNGDGIGDFSGLLSKLDYIKDLGVTALYIMPVHPASSIYFGGYEVTDYKGIASELGSQAQFDQLVTDAHTRGMKVIIDGVFNHTSDEHPWFQTAAKGTGSIYDDYYVWRQDNPVSAWRKNNAPHTDPRFNTYWGKFAVKTPDLNFYNVSVQNTIKDVSAYWLNRGADGFRLDAPMFLYENADASQDSNLPATYRYWRDWSAYLKTVKPSSFSVGETWIKDDMLSAARYVYQGFDVGFQFDIAYGIQNSLNSENKTELQGAIEQSMSYYPFLQFGTFLSNHDLFKAAPDYTPQRIRQRLEGNKDAKARVAAAWLLTAPGVPFVYYGDEVGAAGAYSRKPMQWTGGANAERHLSIQFET
ncbi:alpha-amylase family glycosyl hydrolase [Deinococcus roseus]|uniref:PKD domain-containing protein n=1 Tax=Deinococcus roseus TaxID=392414 RepID=A0ABQ2DDQ7_9DEIO|nr:alpha-amylase family glycosyl hydrolase [Deinococcus roseus]GGJ52368.1 hypothetical protein GCM10008938_42980 [Deinococcus roseus]